MNSNINKYKKILVSIGVYLIDDSSLSLIDSDILVYLKTFLAFLSFKIIILKFRNILLKLNLDWIN